MTGKGFSCYGPWSAVAGNLEMIDDTASIIWLYEQTAERLHFTSRSSGSNKKAATQ